MIPVQGHVPAPLGGRDSGVKSHVMRASLVTDVNSSVFVRMVQLVVPLRVTAPVLQASKESSKWEVCLQMCCEKQVTCHTLNNQLLFAIKQFDKGQISL